MPQLQRRLWHVHVDERSREIGWTIGSKVYRSRLEEGKLDSSVHYDFAVPYNEGRSLPGWKVSLPQFWKGNPFDGRLLRLDAPNGDFLLLDFRYEPSGVPGSLLCELFANLSLIPAEESNHAEVQQAHAADVAGTGHPKRRGRKAQRHFLSQEVG